MQLINFVQASFLLLVIVLATVHGPLTWKRLNPFTCGSFLTFFFLIHFAGASSDDSKLASSHDYAYNSTCLNHVRSHIKRELQASISYLAMVGWILSFIRFFDFFHFYWNFFICSGVVGESVQRSTARTCQSFLRQRIWGTWTRPQIARLFENARTQRTRHSSFHTRNPLLLITFLYSSRVYDSHRGLLTKRILLN